MEMHGKNMIFRIKKDCKLYIMNKKYKSTKKKNKKKFNINCTHNLQTNIVLNHIS